MGESEVYIKNALWGQGGVGRSKADHAESLVFCFPGALQMESKAWGAETYTQTCNLRP